MTKTPFNTLFDQMNLSVREVADILDVRLSTVKQWRSGRREAPPGVIAEMKEWLNNA